jgi:hypothetical protein
VTDHENHDDSQEPELDERGLADQIDDWLTDERPERYDTEDRDWMLSVVDKVVKVLEEEPHDEVIRNAARRLVSGREAQASQKINRLLRSMAETGQLPLWWFDTPEWTIIYAATLHLPVKIAKHKVRFGAMTDADWEEFVIEHKREEDEINATREMTRNGGVLLANLIREQKVRRTEDLRPST